MSPPSAFQKMRANRAARAPRLPSARMRQELGELQELFRIDALSGPMPPALLEPCDLGRLRVMPPT